MTRTAEVRELRRIALLARRAASDWGAEHPEFDEIATSVDRLLVKEEAEPREIEPLIRRLERAHATRTDGVMYDVLRRDLLAELAELGARGSRN